MYSCDADGPLDSLARQGEEILYINEESSVYERLWFKHHRSAQFVIRSAQPGNPVVGFVDKHRAVAGCGLFFSPMRFLLRPSGKYANGVADTSAFSKPSLCPMCEPAVHISTAGNIRHYFTEHGSFCGHCGGRHTSGVSRLCTSTYKNTSIPSLLMEDEKLIPTHGVITKVYQGWDELVGARNAYKVVFPRNTNFKDRASFLNSVLLLDFDLFQHPAIPNVPSCVNYCVSFSPLPCELPLPTYECVSGGVDETDWKQTFNRDVSENYNFRPIVPE